jgi:diguanylate cyclase (GGDEF)-like protein/PAS domain S-box-containing protein
MTEHESALHHDVGSLQDLYDHAPCGYLSTTLDGVILRVNETLVALSGYSREELVGTQFASLLTGGGQLFYESRYLPVLHLRGEAREVALDLRHASGKTRPILVNGVVVNDAVGTPAGIRTAVFEYSGRKEYERQLLDARRLAEASESRLSFLHTASRNFSTADTDHALADELASSVRAAFAAPEVSVYLLDSAQQLSLSAGAALMTSQLLATDGPLELAMRDRKVVFIDDTDASQSGSPELSAAMRAARLETGAIVPVFDQQDPLGAFVMFFRRARTLSRDDIELGETFARQAAEVLIRLRVERLLERVPFYDELTGLPTRRLVRARVNEAIDNAQAAGHAMALITVDIEGFRSINDTFGRVAGDEAVIEIVERLSTSVRDGDLIGRFGSDEFVIICSDLDGNRVEEFAEHLITTLRTPLHAGADEAKVTPSIGVAVYSGGGGRPSSQAVFERADQALYRAKSSGGNRAEVLTVDAAS